MLHPYSTREAAKRLGITAACLSRYVQVEKVPAPKIVKTGKASLHLWTNQDIERVRKLLPKIANGRKTRYLKQTGKTQKPQPGAPQPRHAQKQRPRTSGAPMAVPHKQRPKKK